MALAGQFCMHDIQCAQLRPVHFGYEETLPDALTGIICILLSDQMTEDKIAVYTGLNNVRFKSQVKPGDVFETKCRVTKHKGPFYFAEGEGYVDGRLCVKAEFSIAITEKQ